MYDDHSYKCGFQSGPVTVLHMCNVYEVRQSILLDALAGFMIMVMMVEG